jgi:3'-5' exoribonuclease
MGHLVLGSDIVKEFGEQLGTPAELIRVLRHIILSHHGKPEWGAVKAPCMAEAMLVHEIDMIDSRIYQFEKIGADLEPGTMAETRAYTLDGVFVYAPLEM